MRVKKNSILAFVILGATFGYPLVAGLSATLGLPNSLISLTLRATVALLSLHLILENIGRKIKGIGGIVFSFMSIFILFYLLRLTADTLLSTSMPFSIAMNYWVWAIGSAFLPVLGLSMAKNYDIDWSDLYRKAFIITFLASLLVAMNASTNVTNETGTYDSGRARLETLNPISLGHLGVTLFLLSFTSLLQKTKNNKGQLMILAAGVVIGVSLIVASNSRGPIVSATAALFFAWLVLQGRSKGIVTIIFIIVAFAFVPMLIWFENNFGVTTYSRLFEQSLSDEVNIIARLNLYSLALQAFADNLFFGAGIDVAEVGFYPHNVTIEAFMSVGMFGGLLFFAMQILTVVLAWKICRVRKELLWISLIVIQYMVAAQFSGALYAAPQFWAVIGIAVFASSTIGTTQTTNAASRYQLVARNQRVN